jgi:hypothetical protein
MDRVGIDMVLSCLDEVRKRDGDVKLAALSPEAQGSSGTMRNASILEAFATSDDAGRSFNAFPAPRPSQKAPGNAKDFGLGILRRAS